LPRPKSLADATFLCLTTALGLVLASGQGLANTADQALTGAQTASGDPTPARAANDDGLQEIVVTARKHDETLQKVPLSVTAVTGAQLKLQSITTVFDLQQVPSLFVQPANAGRHQHLKPQPIFGFRRLESGQVYSQEQASVRHAASPEQSSRYMGPLGQKSGRSVMARHVPLEGAQNFRDFGGYATEDGRQVKRDHLFRSGHLTALSEADHKTMEASGKGELSHARISTRWQDICWSGSADTPFHPRRSA
jgi:hypothetical protein